MGRPAFASGEVSMNIPACLPLAGVDPLRVESSELIAANSNGFEQ